MNNSEKFKDWKTFLHSLGYKAVEGIARVSNLPPIWMLQEVNIPLDTQQKLSKRWEKDIRILTASTTPLNTPLLAKTLPYRGLKAKKQKDLLQHMINYVPEEKKQQWPSLLPAIVASNSTPESCTQKDSTEMSTSTPSTQIDTVPPSTQRVLKILKLKPIHLLIVMHC